MPWALAVIANPVVQAQELPDPVELSKKLDELYRADSSRATVSMEVTTPHYHRQISMNFWTQGDNLVLVRIESPKKEKGIATLKRDNEMWNHLPKIGKTIRIPPSMMSGSWMGSDFTNDDLVKESSWRKDYHVSYTNDAPKGQACLNFKAKEEAAVTWDRVRICLLKDSWLPVLEEFFDEKGKKVRVMAFSDLKKFGDQSLFSQLTLTSLTKKGHVTKLTYESMEFGVKHPKNLFTLTSLRKSR